MAISSNEDAQPETRGSAQADRQQPLRLSTSSMWYIATQDSQAPGIQRLSERQTDQPGQGPKKKKAQDLNQTGRDNRAPFEAVGNWDSAKRFKTRSGIRVRSKIEKIIADYFYDRGIAFIYEPPLD